MAKYNWGKAAQDSQAGVTQTHDLTAYKWAGFTEYSGAVGFAVTDDDGQLDWYGQDTGSAESVSIDGESHSIRWSGSIETQFTDSDGQIHTEDLIYSYTTDGYYVIPMAGSAFDEGSTIKSFSGHSWKDTDGIDYDEVICFTPDCQIETSRGPIAADELRPGDLLQTADNGLQPLRWIGRSVVPGLKRVACDLHPVLIRKDAFAPGRPARDIRVSPQHRFCLKMTALMFHDDEMLAPAKGLLDGNGIVQDKSARAVSYVHLLLDRHELLFCEGLETESFQPSLRTMAMMAPRTRTDLARAIEGGIDRYHAVRPSLKPWEAPLLQRVS